MFKNPFSFEGRIRRTEYGISLIIYTIAYILSVIISGIGEEGAVLSLIFFIPLLWFLWAQGAKRCHDVGNSGWWQLIPFYGFWLLFQDGQYGSNQYGENPKGIASQQNSQTNQNQNNYNNQQSGYSGGYSGGHNNQGSNYGTSDNQFNKGSEYKEGDLYK